MNPVTVSHPLAGTAAGHSVLQLSAVKYRIIKTFLWNIQKHEADGNLNKNTKMFLNILLFCSLCVSVTILRHAQIHEHVL